MDNYAYIDTVAKPLKWAIEGLALKNIKYTVSFTKPKRSCATLDKKLLFVVRQRIDNDGVYNLIAAASIAYPKNFENGGEIMAYKITDDCVACGSCAAVCPTEAIKEGDPIFTITEDCVDCGSCAETCPTGAIVAPE